jgi:hypothetical protein
MGLGTRFVRNAVPRRPVFLSSVKINSFLFAAVLPFPALQ